LRSRSQYIENSSARSGNDGRAAAKSGAGRAEERRATASPPCRGAPASQRVASSCSCHSLVSDREIDQVDESGADLLAAQVPGLSSCDHHDVESRTQPTTVATKPLPNASLHPVAHHSVPDLATRRDPEARTTRRVPSSPPGDEHHKLAHREPHAATRNPPVFARRENSVRPLETAGLRVHGYLEETDTASCLRPFARRRLSTARPARVFIRSRNPCFRSRLIRLGW
jgi:hypothetical protein